MEDKRWLNKTDIRREYPFLSFEEENEGKKAGLPILGEKKKIFVDDTEGHNLVFGSTGSKKSRLIAMPYVINCLLTNETIIVSDLKGEIYSKTYKLAEKRGYRVLTLNFRDTSKSDFWNPFQILEKAVKEKENRKIETLTKEFAEMFVEKYTKDPYWHNECHRVIRLYLNIFLESSREIDFYTFIKFLYKNISSAHRATADLWKVFEKEKKSKTGMDFQEKETLIQEIVSSSRYRNSDLQFADVETVLFFEIYTGLKKYKEELLMFLNLAENTRSCVVSMISSGIEKYLLDKNLFDSQGKKEIRYENLMNEKTILYLIIPEESSIYDSLLGTFVSHSYSYIIDTLAKQKKEKLSKRCEYILDEFANIKKIENFDRYITMSRSRNIRFTILIQNINQLKSIYESHAETIISNCDNIVFLYSNTGETLDFVYEKTHRVLSKETLSLLSKERNEALIMLARKPFFLTNLLDIDEILSKLNWKEKRNESERKVV